MNPRRLHRSRDRQLAGVAGGIAEYLDIDPTVIRILWIIVGIASGGLAILGYVILALVMPQESHAPASGGWAAAPTGTGAAASWGTPPPASAWAPAWDAAAAEQRAGPRAESRGIGGAAIVGIVLVVFGAIALAEAALPGWISGAILGPAIILALGAALVGSSLRRGPDRAPATDPAQSAAPAAAAPTSAGSATAPVAPASAGPASTAPPWDVTDTQAVDPTVFGPTTAARPAEATDEGLSPA